MTLCCHQPFLFWPCSSGLQPAVCPANDTHDAALGVPDVPCYVRNNVVLTLCSCYCAVLLCARSVSVAFWCGCSKTWSNTDLQKSLWVCVVLVSLPHWFSHMSVILLSSAAWRTGLFLALRGINALFCLDYCVNQCCNCNKWLHALLYEPQSEWTGKLWWVICCR